MMSKEGARPFALDGGEKMIYDVRMGPQALLIGGRVFVVYQAGAPGPEAHPCVSVLDLERRLWGEPLRIGSVSRADHHFGPVLWQDPAGHLHVLYHCHGRDGGRHLVSAAPGDAAHWTEGPQIPGSVSYPRIFPLSNGRPLLYSRTYGHMGWWGYRLSEDGGHSWSEPEALVDFDQRPQRDLDTWAGSYHSASRASDGRSLHVAFVYWDERKAENPLYGRSMESNNRYHLYYLRLDPERREVRTAAGSLLKTPISRAEAESAKIWDSGWRLTNMPSILEDGEGNPLFLLPVAGEESPWKCVFTLVRRSGERWVREEITPTTNTWDGCLLLPGAEPGSLRAIMAVGSGDGELLSYGGGVLEDWRSDGVGEPWRRHADVSPVPGLIYNNPMPVERPDGSVVADMLLCYGWQGPGSVQTYTGSEVGDRRYRFSLPPGAPSGNRGQAFLWYGGRWV
jgi:hypothetical protein